MGLQWRGWGTANQGIGFLQPDLVSQCAGRDVLSSRRKELQYSQDSSIKYRINAANFLKKKKKI
jgi:hypothetical protein